MGGSLRKLLRGLVKPANPLRGHVVDAQPKTAGASGLEAAKLLRNHELAEAARQARAEQPKPDQPYTPKWWE